MKLRLVGISFISDTIEFRVPNEIMERTTWKAGFAEIDLSEISDLADHTPRQAQEPSSADPQPEE